MTIDENWTPPPGKPQVSHVQRPQLPWETTRKTYCGKDPEQFKSVISLDAAQHRFKEVGRKRATYELCVTCVETANRASSFDLSPCQAVAHVYANRWWRAGDHPTETAELRAVALLIEAHREEFDEAIAALLDTSADDFAKRRNNQLYAERVAEARSRRGK